MSWHPRISVDEECAGKIPINEEIAFWKALDVDQVGFICTKLEPIGWNPSLITDAGIRVANIGTDEARLMQALEFGAATNTDSVWMTPGGIGSGTWEEAADKFCERIAPAVIRAKELGVVLAVEPTNSLRTDISFAFTLRDSLALARAAGIDAVIVELTCCWYERGLEEVVRKNVDMLGLVQIADYQHGTNSSPNRSVVGDGDIPIERLIAMFLDAGYEGMFDLELDGPKIAAEGYLSATRRSLERLSDMLDRLGA
jgi:sugar phosphate isomerase/epimerase